MNEWSDAEISRRLALAIGWEAGEGRVIVGGDGKRRVQIFYPPSYAKQGYRVWRNFDYRDPAVYAPIAERFDCFPARWDESGPKQWAALGPNDSTECVYADTAAKAVALAVIKAKEQT